MTSADNPYAPPPTPDPSRWSPSAGAFPLPSEPPLSEHVLRGGKPAMAWRLLLYPERLYLVPEKDAAALSFTPREFAEQTLLLLAGNTLVLQPARLALRGTPASTAALRAWLAPALDVHLERALSQQFRNGLIWGPLLVLLALPLFSPHRGVQLGTLVYGLGLIALSVARRLVLHRALFLGSACVWLLLAWNNANRWWHGASAWLLALALLFLVFAQSAVRSYRFYGPPKA